MDAREAARKSPAWKPVHEAHARQCLVRVDEGLGGPLWEGHVVEITDTDFTVQTRNGRVTFDFDPTLGGSVAERPRVGLVL